MNIRGVEGQLASLPAILDRKETRAHQQMALLEQGPCVISFSMNIPSACKSFPLAAAGFEEGLQQIRRTLPDCCELQCLRSGGTTGEEALLLINADPQEIKKRMIALEEAHPLGRLWDIDVLAQDGHSLSRQNFGHSRRSCLLCGQDAKICGRSRAHSHEELFWRAAQILDEFFRDQAANTAAHCIARAMLAEVSATPKPGLVDRNNTGSHKDMDYDLFLTSISALEPHFLEFFRLGWDNWDTSDQELFSLLRAEGLRAEASMFAATNGVNTHKGMVFSAAILCGALGRTHSPVFPVTMAELRAQCSLLGSQSLSDFDRPSAQTAGLQCYQTQHISGIRGEAASGFPSAFFALEPFQAWRSQGVCENEAALYALIHLISQVIDTNMIHRGGIQEAARRRYEAQRLLPSLSPDSIVPHLHELDRSYISANLSPGGCADLLSLAIAIYLLKDAGLLSID